MKLETPFQSNKLKVTCHDNAESRKATLIEQPIVYIYNSCEIFK